jgi:hypothetical protein
MLFPYLLLVAIGATMIVTGIIIVMKSDYGIRPALLVLAGFWICFYAPGYFFGPESIVIGATTQAWIDFHLGLAKFIFGVYIVFLIVDMCLTYFKERPLTQHHHDEYADSDEEEAWMSTATRNELIFTGIALVGSLVVAFMFNTFASQPHHPLRVVVQTAHQQGYPVQLSPFIIEVPTSEFSSGIDGFKTDAVAVARSNGMQDLQILHVYSLRFIANDDNQIDEIQLVVDATYKDSNAPGRPARAASPNLRAFPLVAAGRGVIDRAPIGIPQEMSDAVTNRYAETLRQIVADTTPRNGSGLSSLPPSTAGSFPARQLGVRPRSNN